MLFENPPKPRSPYQPSPKTFLSLLALVVLATFPVQAVIQPSSAVTLEWDAVPETDIQGYRLFVGTQSGQYDTFHDAGRLTSFEVTQLQVGQTYYFAVLAVGITGLESDKSVELAVTLSSQPMAAADSYPTFQDTPLNVEAPGVLANDRMGASATMEAVINTGPSNGSVRLNADGSFAYTPATGYLGADSFTYHVNDGTLNSNVVTVEFPVKMVTSQLIVNGGFESNFTGWTPTGNQGVQSAGPYMPTEGSQLVAFNDANRLPDGVLAQSFATVVGQTYTLEFDAGVLAYNANPQAMQVNVTGISNSLSKEISVTAVPTGANRWATQSFTFVADSVSSTLTFSDESAFTDSIDLLLDNVRVTGAVATVPRPSILAGSPSLTGSPGNFMVGMAVTEAGSYVLERSENLAAWAVVTTVQLTAPGMLEFQDLQDPLDAGAPQGKRFYRIGFQPTAPVN